MKLTPEEHGEALIYTYKCTNVEDPLLEALLIVQGITLKHFSKRIVNEETKFWIAVRDYLAKHPSWTWKEHGPELESTSEEG